jgi:hypothetical protein
MDFTNGGRLVAPKLPFSTQIKGLSDYRSLFVRPVEGWKDPYIEERTNNRQQAAVNAKRREQRVEENNK